MSRPGKARRALEARGRLGDERVEDARESRLGRFARPTAGERPAAGDVLEYSIVNGDGSPS